jgi:biotin operon repressor
MQEAEIARKQAKTAEQRFLNKMAQDFNYAPKIAQAIYEEAQACLQGTVQNLRPGQMRQILLKQNAPHGQNLGQSETVEVTWTIDAGAEDDEVEQKEGPVALRQVRVQRLLDEALSQGAVASQEDLAQVLHVSVRTIKRDCAHLQEQGILVATRGKLKGIGRGQTHKALIVRRWLQGETYDQIVRHCHHSLSCIKRYVQAFVRVVNLSQKGLVAGEISLLLQISVSLVEEYVVIYGENDTPFCRQRLQEQIERLGQTGSRPKKGRSQ